MGGTKPLEWVARFVDWQRDDNAEHGHGVGAMVERATGRVVGDAGVQALGGPPSIAGHRLRYMVNREYWGRGYATEAAQASLDFASVHSVSRRSRRSHIPAYRASQHVLEKIGMAYEGVVEYDGLDGNGRPG